MPDSDPDGIVAPLVSAVPSIVVTPADVTSSVVTLGDVVALVAT